MLIFKSIAYYFGGLAQLARALALQARGHRFDSDILHHTKATKVAFFIDKKELYLFC